MFYSNSNLKKIQDAMAWLTALPLSQFSRQGGKELELLNAPETAETFRSERDHLIRLKFEAAFGELGVKVKTFRNDRIALTSFLHEDIRSGRSKKQQSPEDPEILRKVLLMLEGIFVRLWDSDDFVFQVLPGKQSWLNRLADRFERRYDGLKLLFTTRNAGTGKSLGSYVDRMHAMVLSPAFLVTRETLGEKPCLVDTLRHELTHVIKGMRTEKSLSPSFYGLLKPLGKGSRFTSDIGTYQEGFCLSEVPARMREVKLILGRMKRAGSMRELILPLEEFIYAINMADNLLETTHKVAREVWRRDARAGKLPFTISYYSQSDKESLLTRSPDRYCLVARLSRPLVFHDVPLPESKGPDDPQNLYYIRRHFRELGRERRALMKEMKVARNMAARLLTEMAIQEQLRSVDSH